MRTSQRIMYNCASYVLMSSRNCLRQGNCQEIENSFDGPMFQIMPDNDYDDNDYYIRKLKNPVVDIGKTPTPVREITYDGSLAVA